MPCTRVLPPSSRVEQALGAGRFQPFHGGFVLWDTRLRPPAPPALFLSGVAALAGSGSSQQHLRALPAGETEARLVGQLTLSHPPPPAGSDLGHSSPPDPSPHFPGAFPSPQTRCCAQDRSWSHPGQTLPPLQDPALWGHCCCQGLLIFPVEKFGFSSNAVITPLSCHRANRLANPGTQLNNLWHNLNTRW